MPEMATEALFCPLASLPQILSRKDHMGFLQDHSLAFSQETGPGWISYDPRQITVVGANDSFKPTSEVSPVIDVKKQVFTVRSLSDITLLCKALKKPVVLCTTRRQHSTTSRSVVGSNATLTDNAFGFDMDFVLILPRGSLVEELVKTLRSVRRMVRKNKTFCVTVDLKKVFEKITPAKHLEFSSREFATWCNSSFWITNFHRPLHSLTGFNSVFFWTLMLPFSWFVAAPYRAVRRCICRDLRVHLGLDLKLAASPQDAVLVHVCRSNAQMVPAGEYRKTGMYFTQAIGTVQDLKPFFRNEISTATLES